MKSWLMLIGLAVGLWSCDSSVAWRDGGYAVYQLDGQGWELGITDDGQGFHGRVPAPVSAVGKNESFVVAERRDKVIGAPGYYVIEIALDDMALNGDEIVEGPFSAAEFQALTTQRGLPDLSERFD